MHQNTCGRLRLVFMKEALENRRIGSESALAPFWLATRAMLPPGSGAVRRFKDLAILTERLQTAAVITFSARKR